MIEMQEMSHATNVHTHEAQIKLYTEIRKP